MFARCPLLALLAVTSLLAACGRREITSYRIAKENDPALPSATAPEATPPSAASSPPATAPGASDMAATPVTTAAGPGLTWTAPAHWKSKPASPMRKGSYAIGGEGGAEADLSITAFPGNVGGELANLNRWRNQLKLPPITEAEFASATAHRDVNGLHLTTVDLMGAGPDAQRILGAMIPHGEATWFIKLTGPDALLAKEKTSFMDFLETVRPAPSAASTP